MNVQVADPRRDIQSAFAERREDAAVLRPVLDPDDAHLQPFRQRLVHDQPGRGLGRARGQRFTLHVDPDFGREGANASGVDARGS